MPMSSAVDGDKYIPTSVTDQGYRPTTISSSTSAQSTRFDRRLISSKNKNTRKLRKISSKTKWSRQKKLIVGGIIAVVVIALIVGAIVAAVLLTRNSNGTTGSTSSAPVVTAYWTLDAVTNDYFGVYNGSLVNGATYFASSSTQPFVGTGRGLSLTSSSSQYFRVASPYLDLSSRSITIEAWIYPTISTTADFGIFGQCSCTTCSNQCLYFIIRNYRLYIGFTNNDLSGNTTLTTNTWYHITLVYNYDTQQQILYINGVQDAIKSNAAAYQGYNGTLQIGVAQIFSATSYFNGYIDNFRITTRAKSAAEILTAATFAAYFSFDSPNPTYDSGPNGLNGTTTNTILVSGRVNQALRFTGSSSYFQAYGFYQMGFAVTGNRPFSISLWINPSAIICCAIVQISPYLNTNCHNMIGLFSSNNIALQTIVQGWAWPAIYGPLITVNTWTHISLTFSFTTGLTLYVNGIRIGATGSFTFGSSNVICYLQIGYYTSCTSNYISNTAYQGTVDEVYVHYRELTQSEVTALANP